MPDFDLFALDKFRLDEEWVSQCRWFAEWADKLAEARNRTRQAKAKLELTEAEVKLSIRREPTKFGFEKVTENLVEELMLSSGKYQSARTAYINAEHEEDVIKVKVDALHQRKGALEDLVKLRLASYFAEPQLPPEDRERAGKLKQQGDERRLARAGGKAK